MPLVRLTFIISLYHKNLPTKHNPTLERSQNFVHGCITFLSETEMFLLILAWSWIRRWCHRQSTHRSRRGGAGGRRISDRRRITRLPVNQPLRSFRARFLGQVSRCIVDQLPQQSSVPPRPSRSKTTRTRTPLVASIPPGEDPLNSRRIFLAKLFYSSSIAKTRGSTESPCTLPSTLFFK